MFQKNQDKYFVSYIQHSQHPKSSIQIFLQAFILYFPNMTEYYSFEPGRLINQFPHPSGHRINTLYPIYNIPSIAKVPYKFSWRNSFSTFQICLNITRLSPESSLTHFLIPPETG